MTLEGLDEEVNTLKATLKSKLALQAVRTRWLLLVGGVLLCFLGYTNYKTIPAEARAAAVRRVEEKIGPEVLAQRDRLMESLRQKKKEADDLVAAMVRGPRVISRNWNGTAYGRSREWATVGGPDRAQAMEVTLEARRSTLLALGQISRAQFNVDKKNTAYRLTVNGRPVSEVNSGDHDGSDMKPVFLHGVLDVEPGDVVVRLEYKAPVQEGKVEGWEHNEGGAQHRLLTVVEIPRTD